MDTATFIPVVLPRSGVAVNRLNPPLAFAELLILSHCAPPAPRATGNLSPEMESYIRRKVSTGFYGNATEVIRDAIRRMQADEERADAFRRAVAEGEAELDRGEVLRRSLSEA
jgi:putative addiction module CopG family antidote